MRSGDRTNQTKVCFWTVCQLATFVPDCTIASDVSPGEGIPVLDKKMKNLDLGDSSANKSGVASNPVNVQSDAEEEANKSKTGWSRFLHDWLVNLSFYFIR